MTLLIDGPEEVDFQAGLAEIEKAEREAMKDVNLRLNDGSDSP